MKCGHCDSEWHSPGVVMFCPFCGSPLLCVDRDFHSLQDTLSWLTDEYGAEILRNRKNTLQFMECYFPEGEREYRFVNMLYASGLMENLFRMKNAPKVIQCSAARQAAALLCDQYGAAREWADYVVGCICSSLGMESDTGHSIINIQLGAERGDPSCQFELAACFRNGRGVERSPEDYLMWLERSADNGYPPAMLQMGKELRSGTLCERNESRAAYFFREAVRSGNWDAVCAAAGDEEISAECVEELNARLQEVLAVKNELSADQLLGLSRYFLRLNNVAKAVETARSAYGKDAKSAWELYIKALLLDGKHESEFLALKVLRETAAGGNLLACRRLGRLYAERAASESDMNTAVYWYRLAAENGDTDAQLQLADIYEHGRMIQQDRERAAYWYRAAARNGSAFAEGKVSFKSRGCIIDAITLVFDDDSELTCHVEKAVTYRGEDYLIITDPETKEKHVVCYLENGTAEGFEISGTDQVTEDKILQIHGGEEG